jgi:rare lipoprotein A
MVTAAGIPRRSCGQALPQRLATALAAGALLLAAGCSTTVRPTPQGAAVAADRAGPAQVPPPVASDGVGSSGPASTPSAPVSRGGGYYLDDGPGLRPPAEIAALAARPDPVPVAEPLHPRANRPYRVMGSDYRPMTRRGDFVEEGIASWYGRRFHGQPTSIGERYDMYGMTAAHPTLPIPSYARVTSLENGRSVVVRVNDRGPFLHGRVIDLSYLAAFKLGYVEAGSAPVRVELLDPEARMQQAQAGGQAQVVRTGLRMPDRSAAARAATGTVDTVGSGHVLQLGAFKARENAQAAAERLARQLEPLQVPVRMVQQDGLHRVLAGPYDGRDAALRAGEQIRALTGLVPLVLEH